MNFSKIKISNLQDPTTNTLNKSRTKDLGKSISFTYFSHLFTYITAAHIQHHFTKTK